MAISSRFLSIVTGFILKFPPTKNFLGDDIFALTDTLWFRNKERWWKKLEKKIDGYAKVAKAEARTLAAVCMRPLPESRAFLPFAEVAASFPLPTPSPAAAFPPPPSCATQTTN